MTKNSETGCLRNTESNKVKHKSDGFLCSQIHHPIVQGTVALCSDRGARRNGEEEDLIRPALRATFPIGGRLCYVVPLCQGVQQIFNIELTLDDQKEHQAKQTPALATLLYVDWDNQRKSDTDRSMVRRER